MTVPAEPPLEIPAAPSAEKQTAPTIARSLPAWRFGVSLGAQVVLVLSAAVAPLTIELTGTPVVLQTQPIDPYDLLRGYSQTLSYDISSTNTLKKLPGWNDLPKSAFWQNNSLRNGVPLYVILQAPATSTPSPLPWKPVRVSGDRPQTLPPNQVALRGIGRWERVEYGLETYYMPEDRRQDINSAIAIANANRTGFVEIRVGQNGRAVPIRLWAGRESFRF